ncbi:MAG: FKBP-type peptidyl-prolyl cis-trans isomerase [Fimbriimonadaceae bacterium]|nr:FKBP-type peptidyl-prolyl cis-trans isomerase [Chitinophagales bacterium]
MITRNKVVTITYELHEDDAAGGLIEKVTPDNPFVFLFGAGGLLPEFEQNLEGKIVGSNFSFAIEAANAYGETDEKAVEYVPKEVFVIDGVLAEDLLVIDNVINLRDQQGHLVRARVIEVSEGEVLLDFNHPLAGVNLFFTGEILDIRNASDEEVSHGHVHGTGGHHH